MAVFVQSSTSNGCVPFCKSFIRLAAAAAAAKRNLFSFTLFRCLSYFHSSVGVCVNTPKPCLAGNTLRTKSLRLLLPPPPPLPQTMPAHLFLLLSCRVSFIPCFRIVGVAPEQVKHLRQNHFAMKTSQSLFSQFAFIVPAVFSSIHSSQHRQRPYGLYGWKLTNETHKTIKIFSHWWW